LGKGELELNLQDNKVAILYKTSTKPEQNNLKTIDFTHFFNQESA
jgi:hypothetical protein